jgi:hypothetical protein
MGLKAWLHSVDPPAPKLGCGPSGFLGQSWQEICSVQSCEEGRNAALSTPLKPLEAVAPPSCTLSQQSSVALHELLPHSSSVIRTHGGLAGRFRGRLQTKHSYRSCLTGAEQTTAVLKLMLSLWSDRVFLGVGWV